MRWSPGCTCCKGGTPTPGCTIIEDDFNRAGPEVSNPGTNNNYDIYTAQTEGGALQLEATDYTDFVYLQDQGGGNGVIHIERTEDEGNPGSTAAPASNLLIDEANAPGWHSGNITIASEGANEGKYAIVINWQDTANYHIAVWENFGSGGFVRIYRCFAGVRTELAFESYGLDIQGINAFASFCIVDDTTVRACISDGGSSHMLEASTPGIFPSGWRAGFGADYLGDFDGVDFDDWRFEYTQGHNPDCPPCCPTPVTPCSNCDPETTPGSFLVTLDNIQPGETFDMNDAGDAGERKPNTCLTNLNGQGLVVDQNIGAGACVWQLLIESQDYNGSGGNDNTVIPEPYTFPWVSPYLDYINRQDDYCHGRVWWNKSNGVRLYTHILRVVINLNAPGKIFVEITSEAFMTGNGSNQQYSLQFFGDAPDSDCGSWSGVSVPFSQQDGTDEDAWNNQYIEWANGAAATCTITAQP